MRAFKKEVIKDYPLEKIPAGVRETPKETRTGDKHQRGPLGPHPVAFISGTSKYSI